LIALGVDERIDVTVVLKPPDFQVIASLFPTHHVDFGWEEDVEDIVRFSVHAGAKLVRQRPITSCTPSKATPIWYGFQYEFLEQLDQTPAENRDFSHLLINKILAPSESEPPALSTASPPPTPPPQLLPSSTQSISVSKPNDTTQDENEKKRKRKSEEEMQEKESQQKLQQ
jgi:hypothetical protein